MLKNSDAISDPDTLDWNLDPTLRIQIQAEYELFLVRNQFPDPKHVSANYLELLVASESEINKPELGTRNFFCFTA